MLQLPRDKEIYKLSLNLFCEYLQEGLFILGLVSLLSKKRHLQRIKRNIQSLGGNLEHRVIKRLTGKLGNK